MNRKSLLSIFLCLISGIALLTGCGGGEGSSKNPVVIEKGPSSDYLGLEDGTVLKYVVSWKDGEETHHTNQILYRRVFDYEYAENPIIDDPIFKTEEEFVGSNSSGNYISKTIDGTNKYYYRGYWNESGEDDHKDVLNDKYLWIENPPKHGVEYEWGFLCGTELISVPAGNFKTLKFMYDTGDEGIVNTYTVWFVPYLGIVKATAVEKIDETEVSSYTERLCQVYFANYHQEQRKAKQLFALPK